MYMPRLRHVKLVNKWHGPFQVIEALHPVYIIEILTNHGIVEEAIPRDRLKKTVTYIETEEIDLEQQNIDRSNSYGASDQAVNLNYDFSDSDDSDLENQNVVGQGERRNLHYNLRSHVRPPNRYNQIYIANAAYFL